MAFETDYLTPEEKLKLRRRKRIGIYDVERVHQLAQPSSLLPRVLNQRRLTSIRPQPRLRSFQFALWLYYFATIIFDTSYELRCVVTLFALLVGSFRNLGLPLTWDTKRDDFLDWVVAMAIQD